MDIQSIFSPGGELDRALPSYSFRDGQLEMAELVDKAIREGKHLVVEAGTGIGKSFGYLAPIFLAAIRDASSAYIISTSTITLEKQLYEKDIPFPFPRALYGFMAYWPAPFPAVTDPAVYDLRIVIFVFHGLCLEK